jgi:O-antigen/teichoic acid export membrane protein
MLGQSEYGLYSLVSSVLAYLTIMDFGFSNSIIRYTAKLRAEKNERKTYELFGMFLFLYVIIGVITVVIGFIMYANIDSLFSESMTSDEIHRARIMMGLLIGNLAIGFPFNVFSSIVFAYEKFLFQKNLNIIRILANTMIMVLLLHLGYKAIALVVVQTLLNIGVHISNCIYCFNRLRIKISFKHFDYTLLKEIGAYSFWIFIMMIVDRLYLYSGQFVLGVVEGAKSVAIFAVAMQLINMFVAFSTSMSGVFLPRVTEIVTKSNRNKDVSDLFIKIGRMQFIVLSFLFVGFAIFGSEFVTLWAGKEYSDVYMLSILIFLPSLIPLSQNIGIVILQARNSMKFRALSYLVISLASVFLQFILVKKIGIMGSGISLSLSTVIGQILIMNIYYMKVQGIDIVRYWIEVISMSIVPVIFLGLSFVLKKMTHIEFSCWTDWIVSVLLFSVIYLLASYRCQFNQYEKSLVINMSNKLK